MGTSKAVRAYQMRRQEHFAWEEVARQAGCSSMESAVVGARKYAKRRGMEWPIKVPTISPVRAPERYAVAKWAYEEAGARPKRRRWHLMADEPENTLGVDGSRLCHLAEQYAGDNDLAWPPPEAASLGEKAYTLAATGVLWTEVTEVVGFDHIPNTIESARRWAEKNDLAWPLFRIKKAA
jgi:hypothetical protein